MKKAPKGIIDPYVFQNLKQTEIMNIKKEHRKMLGDFLVAKGYQISKGGGEKTFTEVFEILKETILQIKKLKESYEK